MPTPLLADPFTVEIDDDELILHEFHETDADVVSFVRDAEDAEIAVHRCLTMGARVLRIASATLDTELVGHRFGEMTSDLDRKIVDFGKRVDESAESLLDGEEGKLALALSAWLEEVGTVLGDTFDETSKKSAIAKLDKVLEDARREQTKAVKQLLDPHDDESPLGQWRSEIVSTVKERSDKIEEAIDELTTKLGLKDAVAEARGKTAVKGFDFEDVVLAELTTIVTPHQDAPEHVGNDLGNEGTKVGDIVVTVNPAETPGRTTRYVIEAKDTSLSLKKALDELEAAMRNRDAEAGVLVFASQAECPGKEPFVPFDRKALVVLDKKELDTSALRLACLWARWTARREESQGSETIDAARVQSLIDSARRALKSATAIKGAHTQAKTAIDHASRNVDALVGDLKGTLDQLEQEIAGAVEELTPA